MPGIPIWVAENGRPIAAAYDRGSGALAVLLNGEPAGNYTMRVEDARGHWGISLDADDAAAPGVASYPLGAEHLDVLAGSVEARLQVGAGSVTSIEGERTLTASVPVEVVPGLDAQRLPDRAAYMVYRTALYGAIIQDGPEPGRVTLAVVCDGAATVMGLNLTASANDAEDRYVIFGDSVRAGAVPLGNPRHASTDAGLDATLVPGGVDMLPHVALTVPRQRAGHARRPRLDSRGEHRICGRPRLPVRRTPGAGRPVRGGLRKRHSRLGRRVGGDASGGGGL